MGPYERSGASHETLILGAQSEKLNFVPFPLVQLFVEVRLFSHSSVTYDDAFR